MPSAREIRQKLLDAESPRLKAREEAILAVVGAAERWRKAAARATEAEHKLHELTAAATELVSHEELAEFGRIPVKDVKAWARNGAGPATTPSRPRTRQRSAEVPSQDAATTVTSPAPVVSAGTATEGSL